MLWSWFVWQDDVQLANLGECIYDQGGDFVINCSRKVILAHERMSNTQLCMRLRRNSSRNFPGWLGQVAHEEVHMANFHAVYSNVSKGWIENHIRSLFVLYSDGNSIGYYLQDSGINDGSLPLQFRGILCHSRVGGGIGLYRTQRICKGCHRRRLYLVRYWLILTNEVSYYLMCVPKSTAKQRRILHVIHRVQAINEQVGEGQWRWLKSLLGTKRLGLALVVDFCINVNIHTS